MFTVVSNSKCALTVSPLAVETLSLDPYYLVSSPSKSLWNRYIYRSCITYITWCTWLTNLVDNNHCVEPSLTSKWCVAHQSRYWIKATVPAVRACLGDDVAIVY
jgi:hypothetical protein